MKDGSVRQGTIRPIPRQSAVLFLTVGVLWFILCRQLSNEWSANEQYSYGWFVPFFVAYLFWLRWENRPGKVERRKAKLENSAAGFRARTSFLLLYTLAFLLSAALLPIRLFELANPDWRLLSWLHALAVVGLTLLVIGYGGGRNAVRHFAFPVCFILVAVPWVTPIEAPIVQGLMRVVAAIACEAVNLLGIPAQLEGSVIRISSGVVGVNEACSGVRSLQTSLMIGLLFGELKRFSLGRRIALVAGALTLAFVANCARALFLVWIAATRNIAAVGQWHDLAGYLILLAVFFGTMLLAGKVESSKAKVENREDADFTTLTFRLPPFPFSTLAFLLSTFSWLLLVEASVSAWYRVHERNLVTTQTWGVKWPESNPGYREIKIDENVKTTLRYDTGREATWPLASPANQEPIASNSRASISMFFFRWNPGTTSILRARAHRPDICLPNTGWKLTKDNGVRGYSTNDGLTMPFRHFTFTRPGPENLAVQAHAFFCESEDRIPRDELNRFSVTAGTTSNWMRSDRVRVVLQGLRNQGQQVLEIVIMTPHPVPDSLVETEFADLLRQVVH